MVAKPPKPGRDPAGKFSTLQDVRATTGATTQEIKAVMPGGEQSAPVDPVDDDASLKPPMKSAVFPALIAVGMFLAVGAIIFSLFH